MPRLTMMHSTNTGFLNRAYFPPCANTAESSASAPKYVVSVDTASSSAYFAFTLI